MIKQLLNYLSERPRTVLTCGAVIAVLALCGLFDFSTGDARLDVDPSLRTLLPRQGNETAIFDATAARFSSDDLLFVAWVDEALFTPRRLAALKAFTRSVESLPGVDHVESLATALRTQVYDDYSDVQGFLATLPPTLAAAHAIRVAAIANPIYAGYLVSRDGQGTMVAVRFKPDLPARRQLAIIKDIAAASRAAAPGIQQFLSGPLYVRLEISRLLLSDLLHVMPLAIGATLLVAALGYRHWRGVVVPLFANGLALAVSLAVFVYNGHALSYVTVILPPTIYVVGFAYAIHVISDFDMQLRLGRRRVAAARAALDDAVAPVSFAALTTVIGFASLMTSDIDSIRLFGAYAALGTSLAWLAALCIVPAALALWPLKDIPRRAPQGVDRIVCWLADFAARRRRWMVAGGILLGLWSVLGVSRIEVGTDYLSNFDAGSTVRRHFERLNTLFAGAVPLQVVIEGQAVDTFKTRAALRAVADLQTWLRAQPEIGGVYSLLDYLGEIERTLTPEAIDDDPVPASNDLASHLLLLGAGEDVRRFADSSFRTTLLQIRARSVASADLNALSDRIATQLEALPPGLHGYVTGSSYLIARTLDDVTRGQFASMATSLLPIFIVLACMLRSLRIGAIALIPNVLPVLVFFGILGWNHIPLNLTTSLIAAVVFGIAVDDTIHLLLRLRKAARGDKDDAAALRETLVEVIRPVTFTTVGLALGFLTLTVGALSSQADFGLLSALTLVIAWLLEVSLTPALGLYILQLDRRRRGPPGA